MFKFLKRKKTAPPSPASKSSTEKHDVSENREAERKSVEDKENRQQKSDMESEGGRS